MHVPGPSVLDWILREHHGKHWKHNGGVTEQIDSEKSPTFTTALVRN